MPIKARPGVLLAAWRHVLVAGDVFDRMALGQGGAQCRQGFVLGGLEVLTFQSFEFDADRVIVSLVATPIARCPRVPGALVTVDELP